MTGFRLHRPGDWSVELHQAATPYEQAVDSTTRDPFAAGALTAIVPLTIKLWGEKKVTAGRLIKSCHSEPHCHLERSGRDPCTLHGCGPSGKMTLSSAFFTSNPDDG